jgi:hypothetical protein
MPDLPLVPGLLSTAGNTMSARRTKKKYESNPAHLALIQQWLDNFTLPVIDGPVGHNYTFDNSDFVFIHLAMLYCSANQLLSIDGKGGPSIVTVALLLGKSNPHAISQFVSYRRRTYQGNLVVETVDVYKAVITFLRKILRSDDDSRSFTLFCQSFDAASVESVILITSGLVGAGEFVINEETIPIDPHTLITNLLSGNNIVSPAELRMQGERLVCLMYRHCKEQLLALGRKNLPIGADVILIDIAANALGLESDFLDPKDIKKRNFVLQRSEASAKKKSEELANVTGASKPAKSVPGIVRFNQIVQQEVELDRVVTVSPLDAPGLIPEVHARYPLLEDDIQHNDSLSWNSRPFREAVASLDCLGQIEALARFTRDPMVNRKDWMPAPLLEQIVNKIANILACSNNENPTSPIAKYSLEGLGNNLSAYIESYKIVNCRLIDNISFKVSHKCLNV